ncbi:helix-turn-helix transcriptional regulator [Bacillus testis]|uniref:helix-turn-helix transcriptional regulator n=1 Tax=Bacillus testis TaxID=1622072 RepID=UPI00067EA030|nr:helix-turn-helix transcriptional regulator [Bacillus testis]
MKELKKVNIGWLMNKAGYTRIALSNRYEKTPNTISNWCTGKSFPSVKELFDLADILGVKVDDLYEWEEKE